MPQTPSIECGLKLGLTTVAEGFADRRYQDDGSLTPRTRADALIEDEAESLSQALAFAAGGPIISVTGKPLHIKVDSICVHGDGPKAVEFARSIRSGLNDAGVNVVRRARSVKRILGIMHLNKIVPRLITGNMKAFFPTLLLLLVGFVGAAHSQSGRRITPAATPTPSSTTSPSSSIAVVRRTR